MMDIRIRDNGIADGREYYWALCSPCNAISPVVEWPELVTWLADHYQRCRANKMSNTVGQ